MEGGNNGKSEQLLRMQQRKKKGGGEKEKKRQNSGATVPLKGLCRGGVRLDVGSTSPGVYVERVFW